MPAPVRDLLYVNSAALAQLGRGIESASASDVVHASTIHAEALPMNASDKAGVLS
jgi:hypothetical protein